VPSVLGPRATPGFVRAGIVACLVAWLHLPAASVRPAVAGPKTDVLRLDTGDVLTGEIKSLNQGQLTYKTDTMETVTIKWNHIVRLTSPNQFLVTIEGGAQYFGALTGADSDRILRVAFLGRQDDLPMGEVVRIQAIEDGVWDRMSISLSMGLSYTQASEVTQFNFDGSLSYRDRRHYAAIDASTIQTYEGDVDDRSEQFDTGLQYQRTLTGRLFAVASMAGDGNDELGLELRLSGGLGAGFRLVETPSNVLTLVGGVSANREWSTGDETPTNNYEAVANSTYSLKFYESPKTDIDVSGTYYHSLDGERFRVDLDVSGRRELIKDFFVVLSFYENYDSEPVAEDAGRTDRGYVLQLSWSK
jgi:hypothetical protein